jgi:Phage integrase family
MRARKPMDRNGKTTGKARVNRFLQTLKKALRFTRDILKLIDKVPVIKKLPGERNRDYVFTDEEFKQWLDLCPEPLRSASVVARWTGMSRNELIALQKDAVSILDVPDSDGLYGEIIVKPGLKRDSRRRTLMVNLSVRNVLHVLINNSKCDHVFTAVRNSSRPLSEHRPSKQVKQVKRKANFHSDAGLHALRHPFLTEMGELTTRILCKE